MPGGGVGGEQDVRGVTRKGLAWRGAPYLEDPRCDEEHGGHELWQRWGAVTVHRDTQVGLNLQER